MRESYDFRCQTLKIYLLMSLNKFPAKFMSYIHIHQKEFRLFQMKMISLIYKQLLMGPVSYLHNISKKVSKYRLLCNTNKTNNCGTSKLIKFVMSVWKWNQRFFLKAQNLFPCIHLVAQILHFHTSAWIVYYVPREEKTWTVHILCKLPPEPPIGWQFTRDVGWPILLPWSVYYFSL